MEIQVRPSYMTALAELGTAEQKRIAKLIEKLEQDPTTNGLNIEQINNGFISIRANQDIRVIGQKVGDAIVLHYIDHHEEAYDWANKRKRLAELTGGGYRLVAGDTAEEETPTETPAAPSRSNSDYGTAIFDQLIGLGFPEYIARSFETTCNEDELYVRLEVLPENLRIATLEAILDSVSYEAILGRETATTKKVVSLPQEAKPSATTIEASTIADAGDQKHLSLQQNQTAPSYIPSTYVSDKVEAELKRLEEIVSSTIPLPSSVATRPTLVYRARQSAILEDIEEADITDPVVLLRIDRSYRFGITAAELYEATRGNWAITPEKRFIKPRYAMAVVSFVIREVYIIDDWHPVPASLWGPGRWQFDGTVASEKAEFIGKSVQSYINRRSSNPVRYVNCG